MFWNKYLLPSIIVLALTAGLNILGSAEYYYWTSSWFDWMVHFCGGAWVALFVLWISELPFSSRIKPYITVRNVILAVCFVGIAWEIYELAFSITNWHDRGYAFDTFHDLLMDFVGGSVAAFLSQKFLNKKHA